MNTHFTICCGTPPISRNCNLDKPTRTSILYFPRILTTWENQPQYLYITLTFFFAWQERECAHLRIDLRVLHIEFWLRFRKTKVCLWEIFSKYMLNSCKVNFLQLIRHIIRARNSEIAKELGTSKTDYFPKQHKSTGLCNGDCMHSLSGIEDQMDERELSESFQSSSIFCLSHYLPSSSHSPSLASSLPSLKPILCTRT